MTTDLRAVGPDDVPEEPEDRKVTSVSEAAEYGTRLDEMQQMRRVIARALDDANTSPRDLAALSRRQLEISKEIEALERQKTEEAEQGAVSADEEWTEEAI